MSLYNGLNIASSVLFHVLLVVICADCYCPQAQDFYCLCHLSSLNIYEHVSECALVLKNIDSSGLFHILLVVLIS